MEKILHKQLTEAGLPSNYCTTRRSLTSAYIGTDYTEPSKWLQPQAKMVKT